MRILDWLDARGPRTVAGCIVAVAISTVLLDVFVRGLAENPPVERPPALDARLVEIAPPVPAAAVKAPAPAPAAVKPTPHINSQSRSISHPRPILTAPATPAMQAPMHAEPETRPTQPTTSAPTHSTSAAVAHESNTASASQDSGSNSSASGNSAISGNTSAHALVQPLPEIPDDLREFAYQAVALARFTIHTDGTVDVALLKPTQSPRLNQLLLQTLRNWRFFPAMQNGHPVESEQDIRVHFNVG